MVKSAGPNQWEIISGACPELSGTQWSNKPEFCPTLFQVAEPDITLPGHGTALPFKLRLTAFGS